MLHCPIHHGFRILTLTDGKLPPFDLESASLGRNTCPCDSQVRAALHRLCNVCRAMIWMIVVQLLSNHLLSGIFVPAVADSVDEMVVIPTEKAF